MEERPLELVFVRHGESEGNVATKASEKGDDSYFTEEFRSRHSSTWNLTENGVSQAKTAGKWIVENINGGLFDGYYVSSYRRARRTAGFLGLPEAKWYIRDYLREHDWGTLDVMTDEERMEKYPEIMKKREASPYYFAAPGGESLASVVVRARVGIISTLYRDYKGRRAIVVSHGNMMWPVRIIMEALTPESYLEIKKDKKEKINNCQILQYSRIDPDTGNVLKQFEWVRSVCPWDISRSTNEWKRIVRKKYTNKELISF